MARDEPVVKLRKNPSQARSAWTVDLILQAAAQVLEARGEEALTTKTVAERAGVSIGTLYQYFPNRDAILVALAEREAQRIAERMRSLINRSDPENSLDPGRSMIQALIRSYTGRRGARRQFALMITMTGKSGGSLLRKEIAELLVQAWNRPNAAARSPTDKVYAYTMINAILGVLQVAALENSPILSQPDLEEALWKIAAALRPEAPISKARQTKRD
ncbi:MAG TPA: TetR/AcrR family transcriptional regulator [Rhizomicrobium sp.]|jgi:AcrR family transcriptional regulator